MRVCAAASAASRCRARACCLTKPGTRTRVAPVPDAVEHGAPRLPELNLVRPAGRRLGGDVHTVWCSDDVEGEPHGEADSPTITFLIGHILVLGWLSVDVLVSLAHLDLFLQWIWGCEWSI